MSAKDGPLGSPSKQLAQHFKENSLTTSLFSGVLFPQEKRHLGHWRTVNQTIPWAQSG